MTDEALLTVRDVARLLRLSRSWVYAAVNKKEIPAVLLGGRECADGNKRYAVVRIPAWWVRERLEAIKVQMGQAQ